MTDTKPNCIKVPKLENKDWKVVACPPRHVPPNFFTNGKPFIGSIVGQRGSGKTNSLISLIFHGDAHKLFDKIYLFCPTAFGGDPKYDLLETKPHHYELKKYPTYTDDIFRDVVREINADIELYKQYEKKMKVYNKFMKYGHKRMTPEELLEIELMMSMDDELIPPTCKWTQMPTSLCVFDDLVSNTQLYKSTPRGIFYNFAILHRHVHTSLLFICQTYAAAVPRQIRANLSLVILYNLKPKIKLQVADEMCANLDEETFVKMWDSACIEQYDFFLINFDLPVNQRYRRNFDTIFLLNDFKEKSASK